MTERARPNSITTCLQLMR